MSMSQKRKRSKIAVAITILYLLALSASLVIMILTVDDTPMSGIFLVMVTMPWSFLLGWIKDLLQIESLLVTTIFLVSCGLLNSFILYSMTTFVAGGYKDKPIIIKDN